MPALMIIGFPPIQIIIMSGLLLTLGVSLVRRGKEAIKAEELGPKPVEEITSEVSYYKNMDNIYGLLSVDAIGVEVGYSLLPLVDEKSGGNFLDRIVMLRKQFADEMGMVIPSIRLKDSSRLNPNQYEILLRGESIAVGEVLVDYYLGLIPDELAPENAVDGIETTEPAFGMPAVWISEDNKLRAEMNGYTLIDPTSVIITHLSEIIKRHAHELLSRQEIKHMLENLKKQGVSIVDEVIPELASISDLQHVLKNLLREGIPILDMELILETLSDYAPKVKDTDMLTEYVRQSLKRTITSRFSSGAHMKVLTLDAEIENAILKNIKRTDGGAYLTLEPEIIQKIMAGTKEQVEKMRKLVQEPIILTSPVVRVYYKKLLDQFYPKITVLSFNDLDPSVQVQSLGVIKI